MLLLFPPLILMAICRSGFSPAPAFFFKSLDILHISPRDFGCSRLPDVLILRLLAMTGIARVGRRVGRAMSRFASMSWGAGSIVIVSFLLFSDHRRCWSRCFLGGSRRRLAAGRVVGEKAGASQNIGGKRVPVGVASGAALIAGLTDGACLNIGRTPGLPRSLGVSSACRRDHREGVPAAFFDRIAICGEAEGRCLVGRLGSSIRSVRAEEDFYAHFLEGRAMRCRMLRRDRISRRSQVDL